MPELEHDDETILTIDETDDEQEQNLEPPSQYKVVFLNDDYTSMEFVVKVLETIFHLNHSAASQVMLDVHQHGRGTAGIYTQDIAETKQAQAMHMAQKQGHPLAIVVEKV